MPKNAGRGVPAKNAGIPKSGAPKKPFGKKSTYGSKGKKGMAK